MDHQQEHTQEKALAQEPGRQEQGGLAQEQGPLAPAREPEQPMAQGPGRQASHEQQGRQAAQYLDQSQDHIHQELIPRAASFFKVVGDETRMKILCSIAREELCVNDIADKVSMTKSAVSHQLKLLKDEALVKARRDGKNIFYSLDDHHVLDIIEIAFTHIDHKCHEPGCNCAACRGEE